MVATDSHEAGGWTARGFDCTLAAMNESELEQCCTLLGVAPTVTMEELERAFMKKNFSMIKGKVGAADEVNPELEAQRQALRAAYDRLHAHLQEQQQARAAVRKPPQLAPIHAPPPPPTTLKGLPVPPVVKPRDPADDQLAIFRFDSWAVNVFMPPLLLGGIWLVSQTFAGPLFQGPSVCVHEFGHATASWLVGWRATPTPWGYTPVEKEYSNFVYFGLLLLLGLLFAAGVKERKVWPMIAAMAIASLQFYMTWRLPFERQDFWMVFGGVGGEFMLSTLLMMAFWVPMPDKFKWGAVRYLFFLIGAAAFVKIWSLWQDVYHGRVEIPFGSMINGEEDGNGDMNRLMDEFGWKKFDIRRNYWLIGKWCWVTLGVTWLVFVLRLNQLPALIVSRFSKTDE